MAERQYYPRETLGALVQSRSFILHVACFSISLLVFFVLHGINFWYNIMVFSYWAVHGLATANYLGTILPFTSLLSWILIDQNSWLVNTLILFVGGIIFIVCGVHLFLQMNKTYQYNPSENDTAITKYFASGNVTPPISMEEGWEGYFHIVNVFVIINFFQGVFYVIFGYYCCLTMDVDKVY